MSETPKIYGAMSAILADMDAIGKDKKTDAGRFSFRYRGIDDVYNALHPLLAKHKVFIMPEVLDTKREERTATKNGNNGTTTTVTAYVTATVKYTFISGEDGSSVSCVIAGEGMDSGDKATPKALSIAMKYALFQAFAIPTEDVVDPDAEVYEVQPQPQTLAKGTPVNTKSPTMRKLFAVLGENGLTKREQILPVLSQFFGRQITSSAELTENEALEYINAMQQSSTVPADCPY